MLLIARRTALAAALLLVMPLTVWLSGWLWQPGLPVAKNYIVAGRRSFADFGSINEVKQKPRAWRDGFVHNHIAIDRRA